MNGERNREFFKNLYSWHAYMMKLQIVIKSACIIKYFKND